MPEAQAIAVGGDRIVAIGSSADIRRYVGPTTQVVDLKGQLAIPGFIEGHGHFTGVGQAQLQPEPDEDDHLGRDRGDGRRAAKKAKPGQWIYGRGWHQEKWTSKPEPNVEGFPTHASLSGVARQSGAPDPRERPRELRQCESDGALGHHERDAQPARWRHPQGCAGRSHRRLARNRLGIDQGGAGEPPRTEAETAARARRILELASQESVSKGITSFQDAGSSFADVDLMKQMIDEGKIGVRLWIMIRDEQPGAGRQPREVPDGRLRQRPPDRSRDQAIDRRRARLARRVAARAVRRQAGRAPGSTPRASTRFAEPRSWPSQHDYQLCVHAIGDRANRETLNIFEEAFKANPGKKDLRWRVEHAQHFIRPTSPASDSSA